MLRPKYLSRFDFFPQVFSTLCFKLSCSVQLLGKPMNYTLKIEVADQNFEESVEIYTVSKRYSVFIQTDKPIYKSGDTVNFRVLVLDSKTIPYQFNKMIVELFSNVSTKVHEYSFERSQTMNSVAVNSFVLSEEPTFGVWKIRATIDGETDLATERMFKVSDDALPRFEIEVDTKPKIRIGSEKVTVKVGAKYTFGEFVNGTVTIIARSYDMKNTNAIIASPNLTKQISNLEEFQFDRANDLQIVNLKKSHGVSFEITFEEFLTKQSIKKIVAIELHDEDEFFIEFAADHSTFKPGFDFNIRAVVTSYNGSVVSFPNALVQFDVEFNTDKKSFSVAVKNGVASESIPVPLNATNMIVTASYDKFKSSPLVPRLASQSKEFLAISLPEIR
jgi:CD109 antigen